MALNIVKYILLQVLQGKVWVYGEGGPRAFIDSAAVQPARAPNLAVGESVREAGGGEALRLVQPYVREFPYGEQPSQFLVPKSN